MKMRSAGHTGQFGHNRLAMVTDSVVLDARTVSRALHRKPARKIYVPAAFVGLRNGLLLSAVLWGLIYLIVSALR